MTSNHTILIDVKDTKTSFRIQAARQLLHKSFVLMFVKVG